MAYEKPKDYVEVADRIKEFKQLYPEGSLQPADPLNPYRIETIDGKTVITYTAAAYRSPDDPRPGIGVASEPYPGKTPYTRDSELMNAETSAWGRAIVAVGIPTKHIASANEVRNRQTSGNGNGNGGGNGKPKESPAPAADEPTITMDDFMQLAALASRKGRDLESIERNLRDKKGYTGDLGKMPRSLFTAMMAGLERLKDAPEATESTEAPQAATHDAQQPEQAAQATLDALKESREAAEAEGLKVDPVTGEVSGDEDDVPGMDADEFRARNAAKKAEGPKASKAQLAKLAVLLKSLPEEAWRSEMEYRYGVTSRSQLTKEDATAFIDWATEMCKAVGQ